MEPKKKSIKIAGEIWVTDFTQESALKFREDIMEHSKGDPTAPITVYIHSYGGYVDALASMIETMDETPNPIITVCNGMAMSCGAMLLAHGDVRYCGKHSRVMVHEISSASAGDVHDMHADALETKRLNKYFMGLLAKDCGIEGGYEGLRKLIKARDGRDMYLSADECIQFGICDAIGTPKVEATVSFNISKTPEKGPFIIEPASSETKPMRVNTKKKPPKKAKK